MDILREISAIIIAIALGIGGVWLMIYGIQVIRARLL